MPHSRIRRNGSSLFSDYLTETYGFTTYSIPPLSTRGYYEIADVQMTGVVSMDYSATNPIPFAARAIELAMAVLTRAEFDGVSKVLRKVQSKTVSFSQ